MAYCPVLHVFMTCSTYSPVVHGSGRWWLDLMLSLLFAADYVHRTLVGAAACCGLCSCSAAVLHSLHGQHWQL